MMNSEDGTGWAGGRGIDDEDYCGGIVSRNSPVGASANTLPPIVPPPWTGDCRCPSRSTNPVGAGLKFEQAMLGPQRARHLLASAGPRRPVRQELVNAYSEVMGAGGWLMNGVPLVIAASGHLIDGRHRLMAAVQANIAFPTLIATGIPEDIVDLPDRHRRRSFAQVLEARGIGHARAVEALLMRLLQHHDGTLGSRHAGQSWSRMERVLRHNPRIIEIAAQPPPAGMPQTLGHMLFFMGGCCDPAALARLMSAFADPALHARDEPGAVLRHALAGPRKDRSANARATRELAFAIIALNAAVQGQAPRRLAWSPGRPLPVLQGYPPLPGADWRDERTPAAGPGGTGAAACGIDVAMVTPAMAAALLESDHGNRQVLLSHVESLARDMREGRWAFNPRPICLAANGRVLDGRHRLRAIIEAGVAVEMPIMRGLPEAAFDTYDRQHGQAPALAEILPGFGDGALLAAMANLLWRHERCPPGSPPGKASAAELRDILAQHPRLAEMRTFARRMVAYATPSALGYAAYVIERENPVQGAAFLARLDGSLAEPPAHPVSRLRRRLLAMRRAGAGREAVLAAVLECFRAGRAKA